MLEGNKGSTMGNETRTSRMVDRLSIRTRTRAQPSSYSRSEQMDALRAKLINATVEVLAEGSVLRLGETRVRS
jgi:hypothetical protein